MGLNIFSSSNTGSYKTNPINPNPALFTILQIIEQNGYVMARVNYPNCTNYNGDKILVWKNVTLDEIKNLKVIDPHFIESRFSPIARFAPTDEGVKLAESLISIQPNPKESEEA